ncbi:hypothetical protein H632_c135p2, partial [Helicosporidium sp. ATCC 50920]
MYADGAAAGRGQCGSPFPILSLVLSPLIVDSVSACKDPWALQPGGLSVDLSSFPGGDAASVPGVAASFPMSLASLPPSDLGGGPGGPALSSPPGLPSELDAPEYSTDDFRMFSFKVCRCPKRCVHDWRSCPYAHPTENARRRDPRVVRY